MVVAPLLIPLGEIVGWAVALGVCFMVIYFARAFFGTASGAVGWIPWVGKIATTGIDRVAQKIDSVMSSAVASVDAKMGAALHSLARLVDWIGTEVRSHANMLQTIATLLLGVTAANQSIHGMRALIARISSAQRTAALALHRVAAIEEQVRHGIGADVLPRVKVIERTNVITRARTIPGVIGRVGRLDRDLSRLWKWSHRHAAVAGSVAFAGAVAWALSRLGASWIRCSNWKRAGKQVCGMDANLLESLLVDTLAIVGTLSLVELAKELQPIVDAEARVIQHFWRAGE